MVSYNMVRFFKCLPSSNLNSIKDYLVKSAFMWTKGEVSDYGFGTAYKWESLPRGLQEARRSGKPIFLLIHKLTCPSCQKLKEKFSRSIKLIDLSNYFVMINVENSTDGLSYYKEYSPDGKYVPRILFFTYDGQLIHDAYNRHPDADPNHRYFYSSPTQIIDVMRQVIDQKDKNPILEPPSRTS